MNPTVKLAILYYHMLMRQILDEDLKRQLTMTQLGM